MKDDKEKLHNLINKIKRKKDRLNISNQSKTEHFLSKEFECVG